MKYQSWITLISNLCEELQSDWLKNDTSTGLRYSSIWCNFGDKLSIMANEYYAPHRQVIPHGYNYTRGRGYVLSKYTLSALHDLMGDVLAQVNKTDLTDFEFELFV